MNLQVLYLQVVNTDVIAEGVIDSSHRPTDIIQFLSQPAHLSWGFPEQTELYSSNSLIILYRVFVVMQLNLHALETRISL